MMLYFHDIESKILVVYFFLLNDLIICVQVKIILLVNIQILILKGLSHQVVRLYLMLRTTSLIGFNKILYEALAKKSRIFIIESIFDVSYLDLLFILIIRVTYFRLDMLPIIIVHLPEIILLLFHTFELFLSMNYLYFCVFVDKEKDVDIVLVFEEILLPRKNGLRITIIFISPLASILFLMIEIR